MNKSIVTVGLVFLASVAFLAGFVVPVSATLISDTDGPDTNSRYWSGSDINPSSRKQLINSNPKTEEAWLESLLGLSYDDPRVNFYTKIEYSNTKLADIAVNFTWDCYRRNRTMPKSPVLGMPVWAMRAARHIA